MPVIILTIYGDVFTLTHMCMQMWLCMRLCLSVCSFCLVEQSEHGHRHQSYHNSCIPDLDSSKMSWRLLRLVNFGSHIRALNKMTTSTVQIHINMSTWLFHYRKGQLRVENSGLAPRIAVGMQCVINPSTCVFNIKHVEAWVLLRTY